MVLDEETTQDDVETIFIQRRRKVKAQIVHPEETYRLFQELDLAEMVDIPFRALIASTGQRGDTPSVDLTSTPTSITID